MTIICIGDCGAAVEPLNARVDAMCAAYAAWQQACDQLDALPPLSEAAEQLRHTRDNA